MTVMNEVDRFHLVIDACSFIENKCDSVDPSAKWTASYLRQEMTRLLVQHKIYIHEFGVDMDEITGWKWNVDAK
jgi:xylulose-5-phosphate/fructose-6-phosphate phosphoketolase